MHLNFLFHRPFLFLAAFFLLCAQTISASYKSGTTPSIAEKGRNLPIGLQDPPRATVVFNNGNAYTANTSVPVAISPIGQTPTSILYGIDQNPLTQIPYADQFLITLGNTEGTRKINIKLVSGTGLESEQYTSDIIVDRSAPNGSLTINNGAQVTTSRTVSLSITASDAISGVSGMQFANEREPRSAIEPFASTKTWTLSEGVGVKEVFLLIRDRAGNMLIMSEKINYQPTLPITLKDFTLKTEGQGIIKVDWSTETEKNNGHFELWLSDDGKDFKKAAQVKSLAPDGNSHTRLGYSHNLDLNNFLGSSALAGFGLLSILLLPATRNRLLKFLVLGLVIFALASCEKDKTEEEHTVYVKLIQVDNDGRIEEVGIKRIKVKIAKVD